MSPAALQRAVAASRAAKEASAKQRAPSQHMHMPDPADDPAYQDIYAAKNGEGPWCHCRACALAAL